MSRPIRLTFDPRYSPTVNWLHAEQCEEGLVLGPHPGRMNRVAAAVLIALRAWHR